MIDVSLIEKFEGFSSTRYICPAGKATIGIGSTFYEDGTPVKMTDKPITKERARELVVVVRKGMGNFGVDIIEIRACVHHRVFGNSGRNQAHDGCHKRIEIGATSRDIEGRSAGRIFDMGNRAFYVEFGREETHRDIAMVTFRIAIVLPHIDNG